MADKHMLRKVEDMIEYLVHTRREFEQDDFDVQYLKKAIELLDSWISETSTEINKREDSEDAILKTQKSDFEKSIQENLRRNK